MLKSSIVVLLVGLFFSGCFSVEHKRIKTYQAGDDNLTCEELQNQKELLANKISEIEGDKTIQKTGNVLLGPLFFYDLSEPAALDYAKRRMERIEQLISFSCFK